MKILCIRPVITPDGMTEIEFYFDTETLELEFKKEDLPLLISLYKNEAIDIPETAIYKKLD